MLVDTGATAHILNEKSKFLKFDDNLKPENHYIELADGSRACGIVSAKGRAKVLLHDLEGVPHHVFLEDALYIPSYKQNIFFFQASLSRLFRSFMVLGVGSLWTTSSIMLQGFSTGWISGEFGGQHVFSIKFGRFFCTMPGWPWLRVAIRTEQFSLFCCFIHIFTVKDMLHFFL